MACNCVVVNDVRWDSRKALAAPIVETAWADVDSLSTEEGSAEMCTCLLYQFQMRLGVEQQCLQRTHFAFEGHASGV